jgi:glutaredoxin
MYVEENMRPVRLMTSICLLLAAASAHAELYKWVGPEGKITYSDTPPPASAKQVETKALVAGGVDTTNLPYELAQAVKTSPVTLYTTANCIPCDDGRKLLGTRGIPFSEKTVATNEDIAHLKRAGGSGQLPLLTVGRSKQQGFEPGAWNSALTAAGYPQTSKLPGDYHNPPAQAAAPKPAADTQEKKKTAAQETDSSSEPLPATGNAPPGFRF